VPRYSVVTAFYKYQALGNHFVLLDHRESDHPPLPGEVVRQWCDVNTGVGADGVLSVLSEPDGNVRMVIQNADGSDAGMCGNGIRCVARFLADSGSVGASVGVWVAGRLYRCTFCANNEVSVLMGEALIESEELPSQSVTGEELEFQLEEEVWRGTCHFFGNPHLSIFLPEGSSPMEFARKVGAGLESHPRFSNRVNVSFSVPVEKGFNTVVYERGVGITLACGSGACAVGASAVRRGYWEAGKSMEVLLPGGRLLVTVDEDGGVVMQGGAQRVFEGVLATKI